MNRIIVPFVAAAFALVSVRAFAQASTAETTTLPGTVSTPHKTLRTHGRRAAVSSAASAAGTNDKGQPH